jgi:hypothetical protein
MNPFSRVAAIRRRRFTLMTVATLLGAVHAGSPLVAPLYQRTFTFSDLTLTLVYAPT